MGRTAPLGPQGVPSAFRKHEVAGRIAVGAHCLDGDEQADRTVHGGEEMAVYAYPFAHYARWIADFPHHKAKFVPGGVSENLTMNGLVEADLCVGDVHRIGGAIVQVCQPRQPCFKLALHFDDNQLPKAMVRNGRAGWYYRVLAPGSIEAGDIFHLDDRPNPGFSFERLVEIVNFRNPSPSEIEAMASMTGLATWMRNAAREQLADR
ncbi:MAG: MOSC domain-containing protein [Sphingomonas sp.]|nr:MOSC domain-containing protein [Sphingomonas sp.]